MFYQSSVKKNFISFSYLLVTLLVTGILVFADDPQTFTIQLENVSDLFIEEEILKIPIDSLKSAHPNFDFNYFHITGNKENPEFEIVDDPVNHNSFLYIRLKFKPYERKKINFVNSRPGTSAVHDGTGAYLGQKINYILKDSIYTEGEFISVKSAKVPAGHFPHDALYQFEGPGWESEKVGYRLYLDERNRTDIFGKIKDGLFLEITGKNDLVSDGNESYQKMQEWGRDIFKVGNSLGIGSVASFFNKKVTTVSIADSIYCEVYNNRLISSVKTVHYGWQLDKKYDITSSYSILSGSRLTRADIQLNDDIANLCTGLAKHDNTVFFASDNEGWNYIALWGRQTLENDNLGIALFYNKSNLAEISEDEINYFVVLKPENRNLCYYFAAAWEQEKSGIKNKDEFGKYLDNELIRLNNPVKIIFQ